MTRRGEGGQRRNRPGGLSIVFLALGAAIWTISGLAGQASSLPMAGTLGGRADLYFKPNGKPYREHILRLGTGEDVVVWAEANGWFRLTPSDFPAEAWVRIDQVHLAPGLSVEPGPYLEKIRKASVEIAERETIRFCAVVIAPVWEERAGALPGEFESRRPGGSFGAYYNAGDMFPIYRSSGDLFEWRMAVGDSDAYTRWIERKYLDLVAPRASGKPCLDDFQGLQTLSYLLIRAGSFHAAPSELLPPISFYEPSTPVQVRATYPNWLAAYIKGKTFWFPAPDAVRLDFPLSGLTAVENLRVRSSASAEAGIVTELQQKGTYLALFALQKGWFRITPDRFPREGWVAAEFVAPNAGSGADSQRIASYLERISPTSPKPIARSEPERPRQGGFGCLGVAGGLALIVVIVWVLVGISRREQERAAAARRAQEQEDHERRAKEQQKQRTRAEIGHLAEASRSIAVKLQTNLREAHSSLSRAETEFAERAFAPFWDAVESAVQNLAEIELGFRQIANNAMRSNALAAELGEARSPAQLPAAALVPAPQKESARLRAIVRSAQQDFQFATIFEQRKTNRLLLDGFSTLGDAIGRLGNRLEVSLSNLQEELASEIYSMRLSSSESVAEIAEKLSKANAISDRGFASIGEHAEDAHKVLEGIQERLDRKRLR